MRDQKCQYLVRDGAQIAMASGSRDPLKLIARAQESIKALGFFIGLLRTREWKHILHRRDNGVGTRRGKLHPIREIKALGCESWEGLLGVLRPLEWEKVP